MCLRLLIAARDLGVCPATYNTSLRRLASSSGVSLNRFPLEYRLCGWRAFRLRRRWPVSDERSPLRSGAQAQARLTADQSERSEEHTSELQALMRISYAVFCLKQTHYNKAQTKHR